MASAPEAELLQQARQGDMAAYEALQHLLEPPIRRYVRRMIDHPDSEDDIVQDVFIAFYRHLANVNPPEKVRAYVYRIARNRCYDELRQWRRDQDMDALSLDDEPTHLWVSFTEAHVQPRPDDVTHWLLLHLEVREAMEALPEVQRQALMLYAEEGMSHAEIADIMGCSPGTVKSRVYYAKRNLRGLLRPETLDVLDAEFNDEPPPIGATHPNRSDNDPLPDANDISQEPAKINEETIVYE